MKRSALGSERRSFLVGFQPAFYTLGSHCQLLKCEVNAIYEIVVDRKPEEQEHEEHEE